MPLLWLKSAGLYVMAALYIAAGVNHFLHTSMYASIMPPWLPRQKFLIYASGVFEILLGIFLMPLQTRRFAVYSIIALLIAVFPANIQMSINYYRSHNPYLWLTIVRLPLQFLLIWWAYIYR